MARTAIRRRRVTSVSAAPRIVWRLATVIDVVPETRETHTLILDVPGWPGHRAGQHVDVRLTAEDGYQAERSYSIASPPEDSHLALTVERLDDGEVSPYLSDELHSGDKLELRGPIGGYFVWTVETGGPLLLVAGGSGIVPLMAMLRHRDRAVAWPPSEQPRVFVCGPTPLVEAVSTNLVELGHQPALVKTERFGPTGGSV